MARAKIVKHCRKVVSATVGLTRPSHRYHLETEVGQIQDGHPGQKVTVPRSLEGSAFQPKVSSAPQHDKTEKRGDSIHDGEFAWGVFWSIGHRNTDGREIEKSGWNSDDPRRQQMD